MFRIIILVAFILPNSSCRDRSINSEANSSVKDSTSSGPVVRLPWPLPHRMYRISADEQQRIVTAMKSIRTRYYDKDTILAGNFPAGYLPTSKGTLRQSFYLEPGTAVRSPPESWSDLATHFYAQFPGYRRGIHPNIRNCFTNLLYGNGKGGVTKLPPLRAYLYCVSSEGLNTADGDDEPFVWPAPEPITTDWKVATADGPLGWVYDNYDDVFRFIMLASFDPADPEKAGPKPCMIDPESEQLLLNEFYEVDLQGKPQYTATDLKQVAECNGKRPQRTLDLTDGTHCSLDLRKQRSLLPLGATCS